MNSVDVPSFHSTYHTNLSPQTQALPDGFTDISTCKLQIMAAALTFVYSMNSHPIIV